MKKMFSVLFVLLLVFSSKSFCQGSKETKPERLHPALLVIDIQNAFLQMMDKSDVEKAMPAINEYINLFRSKGYPVIRIYHSDIKYGFGPKEGTEQFEFPKTVPIKDDDPRVIKHYGDAFNKTDLDKILKEKKVNTVFLCGLSAVGCVLATYIGADDNDYTAFYIKGAVISHNAEFTKNIQEMVSTVGYEAINIMLNNAEKPE